MEIVIVVDDQMLEAPVKEKVAIAIQDTIRRVVQKRVDSLNSEIELAVEKYMDKFYTKDKLKSLISDEAISIIAERLRDM